jgi:GMP synthase (glutamine-hydrolysing)
MRNVMVFQHVAHEPLGTLNPMLKAHGLRIRYFNFERDPEAAPKVEGYNGLIVLGGPMGVYEAHRHPHLYTEMKQIELALKMDIPILGICLGAQLLAHVLGAAVAQHTQWEMGWSNFKTTARGKSDPLMSHFQETEKIFQLHGDTFDLPKDAHHLAKTDVCENQVFRYGKKAYGLQCHLEVDEPMIQRWMKRPENLVQLKTSFGDHSLQRLHEETHQHIPRSLELSHLTFTKFIELFDLPERPVLLGSGHEKPKSNKG